MTAVSAQASTLALLAWFQSLPVDSSVLYESWENSDGRVETAPRKLAQTCLRNTLRKNTVKQRIGRARLERKINYRLSFIT